MTLDREASPPLAGPRPEPGDALRGWDRVVETFDAWSAPEGTFGLDREWSGARVVVRVAGRVVGRGSAVRTDETTDLLDAALAACMRDLERRAPFDADDTRPAKLAELVRAGRIELELTGPLTPLDAEAIRRPDEHLEPGLDGVAVRLGGRVDVMGAGELLAANRTPMQGLLALVARLSGEPALGIQPLAKTLQERDAVLYRVRSAHLAQLGSDASPRFLHRGGEVVEAGTLDRAELERFAEGLALHLADELGARAERADAAAQPDAWLAVWALSVAADGLGGPARAAADGAVVRWLASARLTPPGSDEAATIAMVAALRRGDRALWVDATRTRLRSSPGESASEEALRLWALSRAGDDVRDRIHALMASTPPDELAGLLPFAGWACLAARDPEPGWFDRLRAARARVWERQIGPGRVGFEARDLIGGIVPRSAGPLLPTWRTARPVAFAASALGDARMTPADERLGELARVMRSLRFLRQLAVDADAFSALAWGASGWGIRSALWDAEQPLTGSALTLIALAETLSSIDAWDADGASK